MRGVARPAAPKRYQKEKDLRGLALAKQNARFRRKQAKQSPPPEERAGAAASGGSTLSKPVHSLLHGLTCL